jgi:hypothetical protein
MSYGTHDGRVLGLADPALKSYMCSNGPFAPGLQHRYPTTYVAEAHRQVDRARGYLDHTTAAR